MLNRDEFLREITLRICSSLEIKETLRNAFEYLREHFPLDSLVLFILDERMGAIRRIAHAFENGARSSRRDHPAAGRDAGEDRGAEFFRAIHRGRGRGRDLPLLRAPGGARGEHGPDRSLAHEREAARRADPARSGEGRYTEEQARVPRMHREAVRDRPCQRPRPRGGAPVPGHPAGRQAIPEPRVAP